MGGMYEDGEGNLVGCGTPQTVGEVERDNAARSERRRRLKMAVESKPVGTPADLPAKSTKCAHCREIIEGGLKGYRQHIATCEKAKERGK